MKELNRLAFCIFLSGDCSGISRTSLESDEDELDLEEDLLYSLSSSAT